MSKTSARHQALQEFLSARGYATIEELARQHGYSPNRAGKALVTRDGNKNVLLGAIRSVTGRNHRIGVKRSSGAPAAGSSAGQAPPPEDPLAAFLQNSRAQGLDVEFKD